VLLPGIASIVPFPAQRYLPWTVDTVNQWLNTEYYETPTDIVLAEIPHWQRVLQRGQVPYSMPAPGHARRGRRRRPLSYSASSRDQSPAVSRPRQRPRLSQAERAEEKAPLSSISNISNNNINNNNYSNNNNINPSFALPARVLRSEAGAQDDIFSAQRMSIGQQEALQQFPIDNSALAVSDDTIESFLSALALLGYEPDESARERNRQLLLINSAYPDMFERTLTQLS
jgi:hypothetical protein